MSKTRKFGSSERRDARTHPAVPRQSRNDKKLYRGMMFHTSSNDDEIPLIKLESVANFPRHFRVVRYELLLFRAKEPQDN